MQLLGVPFAMLVMWIAQSVESRLGVAAAGWFAALPVSFAVATAAIALGDGPETAARVALSAVGHVGPMIVYGVLFVLAVARWGMLRGFALASLGYAIASIAIADLTAVASVALAAVALVLGNLFQSRRPRAPRPSTPPTRLQRGLSLLSAGAVVAILTVSNQALGPEIAGALGAFPVMSTTIAFANAPREGAANASTVMAGVARSLPIYLGYGLSFALALRVLPIAFAVVTAILVGLGIAGLIRFIPAGSETREPELVSSEP